jgi:hypothetical protein
MYRVGFAITWFIAFIAGWIYAIGQYGFFLGGGLGWIPAAFVAVIFGALWPFIALAVLYILLQVFGGK